MPSYITNSLPQGDALSVIALLAALSMPTIDIARRAAQHGQHISMITYVDDRSFLTQSGHYATTLIDRWPRWSLALGLVENQRKICVVVQKPQVKHASAWR